MIVRIRSMQTQNKTDITIPTAVQLHIQKADTFFAYSRRPYPIAREITEVPPMPNMVPTAIHSKNAGVARDTAAT